jgi:lysophospholipase L1-like esterase
MNKEDREKYWDDAVHLTKDGYDRMGQIIFDNIKSKL